MYGLQKTLLCGLGRKDDKLRVKRRVVIKGSIEINTTGTIASLCRTNLDDSLLLFFIYSSNVLRTCLCHTSKARFTPSRQSMDRYSTYRHNETLYYWFIWDNSDRCDRTPPLQREPDRQNIIRKNVLTVRNVSVVRVGLCIFNVDK
jgi:hypothetical protein